MKRLLSALVLLALAGGVASAGVPDPYFSAVMPQDNMAMPRLVGVLDEPTPSAFGDVTITVRNYANVPISGAYVEIVLSTECELCLCDGIVLTGYTNPSGQVVMNTGLGGCCFVEGGAAAAIYAEGTVIRSFSYVVSPDFNGAQGNCVMALDDFTHFGGFWATGAGGCTDYDGDGQTALGDFTAFGSAWTRGCTPAP